MPRSKELPRFEFFIDRSLGRVIVPDALRVAGEVVHTMAEIYGEREQSVEDEEWLAKAGAEDWIVLTKDTAMLRVPEEIKAITEYQVRIFGITKRDLLGVQMAERFITNIHRIKQRARQLGPYYYAVYPKTIAKRWPR